MEPLNEKLETRKGVKLMFIAISGYLLLNLTNLIDSLSIRCNRGGYLYNYFMGMGWVGGYSYYSMILMIGLYIALSAIVILSVLFFFRGRFEFRTEHTQNIKYVVLFLYMHVMVSAVPIFMYIGSPGSGGFVIVYLVMVGILQGFLLAMVVLYLVHEFAGKFEKDLLYLFAAINIGIPIILSIELVLSFVSGISFTIEYWYNRSIVFSLILLLGWTIAAFGYFRILKDFRSTGEHVQNGSKSFLPRPMPLSLYIDRLIKRPVLSFIWVLIIIIALCSTATIVHTYPEDPENDYTYPTSISYMVKTRRLEGYGELGEGEETSFDVEINAELKAFYIELTWIDEGDAEYRYNQGDCFIVELEMGNVTLEETNSNPNGEQGQIIIDYKLNDDEAFYIDTVNVTIILDYCGDHTGYWGHLPPPLAAEDSSNDYNYYIKYSYFPD
jgi:hypothetical protein